MPWLKSVVLLLGLGLVLTLASPAHAAPHIASMSWRFVQEGPGSRLLVTGRVTTCARDGRTTIVVTERKVVGDRVRASGVRRFFRTQRRRCQTHRIRYRLAARFFGVGQYEIFVRPFDAAGVKGRERKKSFAPVVD